MLPKDLSNYYVDNSCISSNSNNNNNHHQIRHDNKVRQ